MATETEGIQGRSADVSDTTVIVQVTGEVYRSDSVTLKTARSRLYVILTQRNFSCWLVTDRGQEMEARHSSLNQQEFVRT